MERRYYNLFFILLSFVIIFIFYLNSISIDDPFEYLLKGYLT